MLADRVFLGAGVRTVNDQEMTWRDPGREPELVPPEFEHGARVGSGSVILAGVTIGEHALVGAGSVVTEGHPGWGGGLRQPARVRRARRKGGVMNGEGGAVRWLEPLLPAFPEMTAQDVAC